MVDHTQAAHVRLYGLTAGPRVSLKNAIVSSFLPGLIGPIFILALMLKLLFEVLKGMPGPAGLSMVSVDR